MAVLKPNQVGAEIERQFTKKNTKQFLKYIGEFVQGKAVSILDGAVGYETKLGKTIKYKIEGNTVRIFSNSPYALPVEFGTKPHIIRPKKAKSLHWKDEYTGEDRFAQMVKHPGSRAIPYLRPAVHLLKQDLGKVLKKVK